MLFEGVQTAPRDCETSVTVSARPPLAAMVFNLPVTGCITDRRPSGDQNGRPAPLASSSRVAAIDDSDRTHNSFLAGLPNRYHQIDDHRPVR